MSAIISKFLAGNEAMPNISKGLLVVAALMTSSAAMADSATTIRIRNEASQPIVSVYAKPVGARWP